MIEKTIHSSEILDSNSAQLEKEYEKTNAVNAEISDFEIDWRNKPTLADLKADLNSARGFHDDHMARVAGWRKALANNNLSVKKEEKGNKSTLQPKVIRKMAEWRYASLSEPFLSNDELFSVAPRTWEDRDNANKNSVLLNYQFQNHLKLTTFIGDYIRALVNEGTAIIKPMWVSETRTVTKPVHRYRINTAPDEQFKKAFETALFYYDASPSQYLTEVPEPLKKSVEEYLVSGMVAEFIIEETQYVEVQKLVKNHPFGEIFPIDNTYLDPSCGTDYRAAKFVVFRYESSIADLEKDGRYQNLGAINPDSSSWTTSEGSQEEPGQSFNYSDRARKRIEVMEYWGYYDIQGDNRLRPIVVTWVGDTVIRMEESPFGDEKLPDIVVPYMPQPLSPYGEPDAELLEDNQKIVGAVTRGIIDLLAKNANGQQGIAKGMLDPVNRLRFQRGQDYEFNPNFHPDQHTVQHKFPEIPKSAFDMLNLTNAESESLTGVKAFSEGLTQNSLGKVATSVRGVLDAASKRESDILRRAAEGIEELGRRFMSMNADFLEDEEIIRVTNEKFVKVFRKEIAGNYDLKLSIMTAEETAARSNELTFMIQTIAPSLDPSIVKILLTEYARINKLPDVARAIKNYEPKPDPLAEQMAMLQLQEQMLKVEQSKLNLTTTQIEHALLQAKIVHEQAKAAERQTTADRNSLDFVEQESGVKQARDVERIQAQAMGNIALEERKAALATESERSSALEKYVQSQRPVSKQ
jgi:hypothetical protein